MNRSKVALAFTGVALYAGLITAIACTTAPAATDALGKSGKPAADDVVPSDIDYDTTMCTDLSDDVSCGGYYVLACCDSSSCAYIVTDGETGAAVFDCASTSDCSAAADDLIAYCGGGDSGGGGWDTSG